MKRDWKMKKKIDEAKTNCESRKKKKHEKEFLNWYLRKKERLEQERLKLDRMKKRLEREKLNCDYKEREDKLKCYSKKKKILEEESSSPESKKKEKVKKRTLHFDFKERKDKLKCNSKKKKISEEESWSLESESKKKFKKRKLNFDFEEKKEKQKFNFKQKENSDSENYSTVPKGSFFSIMLQNFKEYMYIPPSFAQEIGDLVKQPIYLKHFNDRYWTVFLNFKNGCLAFREGWHKFILNHSIKEGEFLVFTYEGDSVFTVRIFGIDCRERIQIQKDRKSMDGKRKGFETRFKDSHSDEKEMYYASSYDEIELNKFDSPRKKVPNGAETSTEVFNSGYHENKCNPSKKKISSKTEKTVAKKVQKSIKETVRNDSRYRGKINSVKDDTATKDARNVTKFVKKEQKAKKKSQKEKVCSPKLFNESKKVKFISKDKKKTSGKIPIKHTNTDDDQFIRKDKKKLSEVARNLRKSKLNRDDDINAYQETDYFPAPICAPPVNACKALDEYSCTSCTEKTNNLNNLCCDFLVDEDGICHNTVEYLMDEVNVSMFHSGSEMEYNASNKDQIQFGRHDKRGDNMNQNFCNNLSNEKHSNGKEVKDMASPSSKKPSINAKHKNEDANNILSLVPANFRFRLAIPSQNNCIILPKKLPVTGYISLGRRVIALRNPLGEIWPVLYIDDCIFVGFLGGWKSFVKANRLHEGDIVEFVESPAPQFTLQMVR